MFSCDFFSKDHLGRENYVNDDKRENSQRNKALFYKQTQIKNLNLQRKKSRTKQNFKLNPELINSKKKKIETEI